MIAKEAKLSDFMYEKIFVYLADSVATLNKIASCCKKFKNLMSCSESIW